MPDAVDFVVQRANLRECAVAPGKHSESTPLQPGEILVRLDTFALTANNVTYGAVGDMLGYWKFFPADGGWGRIPVWGFAEVVRSRHDAIRAGEPLYGYFPISTYLVLAPDRVSEADFVDATAHRAELPPVYNRYRRVAAGDLQEAEQTVFRPVFTTSFLIDQFLGSRDRFGAGTVVLTSASSKTALGLAFFLSRPQPDRVRVVGLTSVANRAFVEGTGYYDAVVTYDDIASLPRDSAVLVDFAGNGAVVGAVHTHYGAALKKSISVGLTHWERMAPPDAVPGPTPEFFFAPDHVVTSVRAWGQAEFQERVEAALRSFVADAARWLRVTRGTGTAAVEKVYRGFIDGTTDPAAGHLLSL